MDLAGLTSPRVADGATLVVPLGATEQHGAHLPVGTDTVVAVEVCRRVAAARPDVVVAPALPYGSSGEHAGFPGTLSIGQEALEHLLVELVRSADGFGAVVLASGHAGNAEPLARAVARLRSEGRRVAGWTPRIEGSDAHAGRTETSILLAVDPSAVDLAAAEAGATEPIRDLMPALREGGVAAVSPNGVLGDPAGASAEEGEQILQALAADLLATLDRLTATLPPPNR